MNLRTGQVLPIFKGLLDDLEANGHGTLDILGAASRLRAPWLIVHGTADESVSTDDARRLSVASRSGGGDSELLLVEGAGHTFGVRHPWAGSSAEFDHVLSRTVEFFSAALS